MTTPPRRIVAFGGGGFSRFGRYSRLDDYVLGLSGKDHPRVLFLGTAGGDDHGLPGPAQGMGITDG